MSCVCPFNNVLNLFKLSNYSGYNFVNASSTFGMILFIPPQIFQKNYIHLKLKKEKHKCSQYWRIFIQPIKKQLINEPKKVIRIYYPPFLESHLVFDSFKCFKGNQCFIQGQQYIHKCGVINVLLFTVNISWCIHRWCDNVHKNFIIIKILIE